MKLVKLCAVVVMVVAILCAVRYYRRQLHVMCVKGWDRGKVHSLKVWTWTKAFSQTIWDGKPLHTTKTK